MSTDLNRRLLAEIARLRQHLVGCVSCSTCESMAGYTALVDVLEKCAAMRAEARVGAFIAAEFERVIAEQLGVKDQERIEEEGRDA